MHYFSHWLKTMINFDVYPRAWSLTPMTDINVYPRAWSLTQWLILMYIHELGHWPQWLMLMYIHELGHWPKWLILMYIHEFRAWTETNDWYWCSLYPRASLFSYVNACVLGWMSARVGRRRNYNQYVPQNDLLRGSAINVHYFFYFFLCCYYYYYYYIKKMLRCTIGRNILGSRL